MLTKLLLGTSIAGLAASAVLLSMLMNASEANGQLRSEIGEAKSINTRQGEVILELESDNERTKAEAEAARQRAEAAVLGLIASQQQLVEKQHEIEREMARVHTGLTPDERVCADEPVPARYFGMRDD